MGALNDNLIEDLKQQRALMIDYLKLKLSLEDWHGVQDAASDIRELDAALAAIRQVNRLKQ